jgi:phage tail sheath protein FI
MPEYLAPGVYVMEVPANVRAVEGVPTSVTSLLGMDVVEKWQCLLGEHPSWTDHNEHDPGITMLELLAWLSEMLAYRMGQIPDAGLGHASRAAAAALALLKDRPAVSKDSDFKPVKFFAGAAAEEVCIRRSGATPQRQ